MISRMNNRFPRSSSLFKGRQFNPAIIILFVRWYITYKLSYRDLRDMMAERGVSLAKANPYFSHTTCTAIASARVSKCAEAASHSDS
jgi:transposase-like protein